MQPQRFWYNERVGYQGDTTDDGRYWCYSWNVTQEVRLLDSGGNLVVDQFNAVKAVLRTHDGRKLTFELVRTSSNSASTQRMGRLTKIEDANGNAIVIEIKARLGRESNLSAVHVTLYRLEDKGFVKSSMGGATNTRGGRRKRIFTITNAGIALLRSMKEARIDLWKMVPQLKFNY